ncbi:MAG: TatD family hydrolase [bacterium]
MFHDTHVHLEMLLEKLDLIQPGQIPTSDQQTLIEEKINQLLANHEFVIGSTVSTQNYKYVRSLLQNIPKVKYLLGAHPELVHENYNVKEFLQEQQDFIQSLNGDLTSIVGLGECGLDYFYSQDRDIISNQKKIFEAQIELAIELNLPLVIHCREDFDDLFEMLNSYPKIQEKFLIHCFTGNKEQLSQALDLGGKVAFGGIITFGANAEYLRESLKFCPTDSWVLETDLPYLTPAPMRGKICLPEYIDYVAKKASEVKGIEQDKIWQTSRKNVKNIFGF